MVFLRYGYILLNTMLNGISTPILKKLGQILPIYPVILLRGIISLIIFSRLKTENKKLTRSDMGYYTVLIVLSIIGFFTYYTSLKLVDVGLIAIFTINVTMILTLILSSMVLKEKYTYLQWIFILISLFSLTAITYEGIRVEFNIGILLLIINSLVNSVAAILTKKILDRRCGNELSFVRVSVDVSMSTFVLLLTPLLISEFISKLSILIALLIVYLAINSVLLATLQNKSVRTIGVGLTDILKNLTTVVTILIGVIFMGDTYTAVQLVALGVFILSTFSIIVIKNKSTL